MIASLSGLKEVLDVAVVNENIYIIGGLCPLINVYDSSIYLIHMLHSLRILNRIVLFISNSLTRRKHPSDRNSSSK